MSEVRLLATQSILELLNRGDDHVTFSNEKLLVADGIDPQHERLISIPTQVWDDLGQPSVVTMRVDGGDTLNVEEVEGSPTLATRMGRLFGVLFGIVLLALSAGVVTATVLGLVRLLRFLADF